MSFLKKALVVFCCGFFLFAFTGCESEGPAEKAGEKVDKLMSQTKEKVEEAGKAVQESVEEAGEEVHEGAEKATRAIEGC